MILKFVDNFLNKITMYRLTFYCLIAVWVFGFALSFFKLLPFSPIDFTISGALIFLICFSVNEILKYFFKAPSNRESVYITAFILMMIISPKNPIGQIEFLALSCALAMASKYILAIKKKHLFNPAAFGVAVSAMLLNQYAVWLENKIKCIVCNL